MPRDEQLVPRVAGQEPRSDLLHQENNNHQDEFGQQHANEFEPPRDEKSDCTCVQPQSLSDLSASHSSTSTPSASSDICRQNEMSKSCRLVTQNSFSARSDASVVSCASTAVKARVNTNKH